jgi:hypothetical protein
MLLSNVISSETPTSRMVVEAVGRITFSKSRWFASRARPEGEVVAP